MQLDNELLAVQAALYQAADKERRSLLKKESRTWQETQALAELNEDVKSCEAGYRKSKAIDDAIKLQEKYAKSSLPELRAVLRDAEVRADSAKFEYQYLEYDLSPGQSADLEKLLGERYGHIFEEARKTVAETKDLEKQARVAVLAQQLRDRMRKVAARANMLAKRKQLREFMGGEDRRIESLRIIAGLPPETQRDPTINHNMEDLWGKGSEDAAKENSSGKESQERLRTRLPPRQPHLPPQNRPVRESRLPFQLFEESASIMWRAWAIFGTVTLASAVAQVPPSAEANRWSKIERDLKTAASFDDTWDRRPMWGYLSDYLHAQRQQATERGLSKRIAVRWAHVGDRGKFTPLLIDRKFSLAASRHVGSVTWRDEFVNSFRACLMPLPGQVVLFAYPASGAANPRDMYYRHLTEVGRFRGYLEGQVYQRLA